MNINTFKLSKISKVKLIMFFFKKIFFIKKLTPLMSTFGNLRTMYLIADSNVLSDRNAGLDLASPHACNGNNHIKYTIYIIKYSKTWIVHLCPDKQND